MAGVLVKDGKVLVDGNKLRGCCCDECAIVEVNLYVSSFSDPTDASTGQGTHSSVVELYSAVCAAVASCSAANWSGFEACSDSRSCYATNGCGRILSRARLVYGDDMIIRAPWMGGGVKTAIGKFQFNSTRVVYPGRTMTIRWSASIKYYSASGGAPTSLTRKPSVSVEFSTGESFSSAGTDASFPDVRVVTATGGSTAGAFTATVYFT